MTTSMTRKPVVLSTIALITLAACSGGGGNAQIEDVARFGDTVALDAADLTALSLNASAGTVTNETGTLDREGNTLAFGSVSGTISDDRTAADLENGAVTFEGDPDAFAVRFDAAQGATNTLGIIGVAADAENLPTGSASYAGDTVITAISGTNTFEFTGTAAITADFGAASPSVTTALTGLSGTRQPAGAASETVADAGSLTIAGSTISGTGFSGGTSTLDSSVLALSGSQTTDLAGAFYGPNGEEIGGVFIIKDGTTNIFGDFLGE